MVLPIVDEIAKEREDLLVGKINVNDNPDLAREFGVMSIPTLIVMKDGKIVNRVSGAKSKSQILDLVGA
jgi:thioredoxin 1